MFKILSFLNFPFTHIKGTIVMEESMSVEVLEKYFRAIIKLLIYIKKNGKNGTYTKIASRLNSISFEFHAKNFSNGEELMDTLNRLENFYETDSSPLPNNDRAEVILRCVRDCGNYLKIASRYPDDYYVLTSCHRLVLGDFEHYVHLFLFDTDIDTRAYEQEYVRFVKSILYRIFKDSTHLPEFNPTEDVLREFLKANEPFVKSFIEMCESTRFPKVTKLMKETILMIVDYLQWKPLNEEEFKRIRREIWLIKDEDFRLRSSDDDDWDYSNANYRYKLGTYDK